jgi:hypothetical protein
MPMIGPWARLNAAEADGGEGGAGEADQDDGFAVVYVGDVSCGRVSSSMGMAWMSPVSPSRNTELVRM